MGFRRFLKEKKPFLESTSDATVKARDRDVEVEAIDRPKVLYFRTRLQFGPKVGNISCRPDSGGKVKLIKVGLYEQRVRGFLRASASPLLPRCENLSFLCMPIYLF